MSKKNRRLLLVVLIILIVSTAFILSKFGNVSADADDALTDATKSNGSMLKKDVSENPVRLIDNYSLALPLAKLLGALIIVVLGIYGFLYLLRKMMGQRLSGNRGNNLIEVLETTYIAQKKSVSLVRFSDRAVLIGVSDSGISVLAELSPEETSKIKMGFSADQSPSGFKNVLRDATSKIMNLSMGKLKTVHISKETERPQIV